MKFLFGFVCGFFLWLTIGLIAYKAKNNESGQNK